MVDLHEITCSLCPNLRERKRLSTQTFQTLSMRELWLESIFNKHLKNVTSHIQVLSCKEGSSQSNGGDIDCALRKHSNVRAVHADEKHHRKRANELDLGEVHNR